MRSNSWSDSLDDYRLGIRWRFLQSIGIILTHFCFSEISDINRSLLGDSQRTLYDVFKKSYAEMLYCWGLLVQRAKVLKYLSSAASLQIRGVEFVTECTRCKRTTLGPSCQNCKKPLLTCTLCRLPVRGAANACLNCGHGGHTDHLRKWFEVNYLIETHHHKTYFQILETWRLRFWMRMPLFRTKFCSNWPVK